MSPGLKTLVILSTPLLLTTTSVEAKSEPQVVSHVRTGFKLTKNKNTRRPWLNSCGQPQPLITTQDGRSTV
jgi:hypothetical protein